MDVYWLVSPFHQHGFVKVSQSDSFFSVVGGYVSISQGLPDAFLIFHVFQKYSDLICPV